MPYARPQNSFDRFDTYAHEFEAYLEERLMMVDLERQLNPSTSGSGLSEEDISTHLHVYTAGKGNMIKDCEADTCSVCLCDRGKKIGRLECGHQYHAVCIKRWLLSKNSCPMCRSAAVRV
ncbi:putative E3 ubiquitin-protein ligase HIP1 [Bidens hawaiensis]|uniref:putative E3 ubiquitin-protein ligase HIP1 n=1 Tax=Bidens hawaiensis TaxID=980011 RepID=UPI004049EA22